MIKSVAKGERFQIQVSGSENIEGDSLVVATGGLSYKKLGSSDLGYKIARQFGLKVIECRPGLVPLQFGNEDKIKFEDLSGISFIAKISYGNRSFRDGVLITHRGISGPAILQASSYWKKGMMLKIDIANAEGVPARLAKILGRTNVWSILPKATEGYDHAEVTVGGVDTSELSPETFESKKIAGLYFVGEVLDVTGQLGGFNIHWAFASGSVAGKST